MARKLPSYPIWSIHSQATYYECFFRRKSADILRKLHSTVLKCGRTGSYSKQYKPWLSGYYTVTSLKGGPHSKQYKPRLSRYYWAVKWSWFAWVNALSNLSRKKSREVAALLPGRFLSRRYFTLCITMEVESRIVKQYKCHHCCSCKNYRGKGKRCLSVDFWLTRR